VEADVVDSHSIRLTPALPGPGATPQKRKQEVEMKTRGETIATVAGVAIVAVGLLALACTREPTPEQKAADRAKLVDARKQLAQETARMANVTGQIAGPLKNLSEEQIASVVALSYLAESVTLASSPNARLPEGTAAPFKNELGAVHPGLSQVGDGAPLALACFDESVACASALKKCEDDGRGEEACFESWGPCAQETVCVMRQLDAMRGRIGDIFGRLKPPKPIPWPEK